MRKKYQSKNKFTDARYRKFKREDVGHYAARRAGWFSKRKDYDPDD